MHLVDTVHRDVREHSTQHQWPPAVPDRRVDLKTVGTFLYINNEELTHSSQRTLTVPRDRNRRQSSISLSVHRRWPLPLQWPQKQTRTWATTGQIKKWSYIDSPILKYYHRVLIGTCCFNIISILDFAFRTLFESHYYACFCKDSG